MPAVLPLTSASFPFRPRSMRGIVPGENSESELETELHAPRLRRGRRLAEEPRRHRARVAGEVHAVEDVVGLGEEFEIEPAVRLLKPAAAATAAARSTLLLRPRRGGAEHERAAQAHAHVSPARGAARAVAPDYPAGGVERPVVDDQVVVVVGAGRDVVRRPRLVDEAVHRRAEAADRWQEQVGLQAVTDVLRGRAPLEVW